MLWIRVGAGAVPIFSTRGVKVTENVAAQDPDFHKFQANFLLFFPELSSQRHIIGVAEPHQFHAAPAPGENFHAAPATALTLASTSQYRKQKIL
jgi:hypothetical protein